MSWPALRLRRWLGGTGFSVARYLRNVVFAVMLVPVLPNIAVDVFGDDHSRWLNPTLRVAALVVIVASLLLFNQVQLWLVRRREAANPVRDRMGRYDVIVVPMSPKVSVYRPQADRRGDHSPPEVVARRAQPALVIGVATRAISHEQIDDTRAGLRADGIDFETVTLTEPYDAAVTVPETAMLVLELLRNRKVAPSAVCFDTTGGTVPMSLAMLHAASRYGSDCCYVSSGSRDGVRLPNTQVVTSFDPAALAAGP